MLIFSESYVCGCYACACVDVSLYNVTDVISSWVWLQMMMLMFSICIYDCLSYRVRMTFAFDF